MEQIADRAMADIYTNPARLFRPLRDRERRPIIARLRLQQMPLQFEQGPAQSKVARTTQKQGRKLLDALNTDSLLRGSDLHENGA